MGLLRKNKPYKNLNHPTANAPMALPAPRSQALKDAMLDHLENEKKALTDLRSILENHLEKDQEWGCDLSRAQYIIIATMLVFRHDCQKRSQNHGGCHGHVESTTQSSSV